MLQIVKNIYFSKEHVSYYQNYSHTIRVSWDDPKKRFIKAVDTCSFDLIADSEKPMRFSQSQWINVHPEDAESEYYCKTTIKIDNKPECLIEASIIDGVLTTEWGEELSGQTEYHITKKIERRYNFEADHYFGFRAKYITNGMHIAVVHPKDMSIVCIERGTQNNFQKEIFNDECCEFRYNGLILPRQGYVIIMSKTEKP